ncbi:Ig-like domain-containing protein [Aneurinibacillus tyrosinisolvens]|uniref:Ig-like domain-containing protein n=1 Tax=Aneurinibacillus tyrosinisolvens TaxID=1443435 RepID=UPI00069AC171|nr:Ig-like domain-containing protein [Aneurinibacillus tyrosinisolvens]
MKKLFRILLSFVILLGLLVWNPSNSSAHLFGKKIKMISIPSAVEMYEGETFIMNASVLFKRFPLKWEWTNPDVLSINGKTTGKEVYGSRVEIKANKIGTSTITVKYISHYGYLTAATCVVTVKPLGTGPSLDANITTSTPVVIKPENGNGVGNINIEVLPFGKAQTTARKPADVVYVLDTSSNMGLSIYQARGTILNSIDNFIAANSGVNSKNDRIGLLYFNNNTTVASQLISNNNNGFENIKREVDKLGLLDIDWHFEGWLPKVKPRSNYADALTMAKSMLNDPQRNKYIVFLAAGEPTLPENNERAKEEAKKIVEQFAGNITLHSVALDLNENGEKFLKSLSDLTGGMSLRSNSDGLQNLFDQITRRINQVSLTEAKLKIKLPANVFLSQDASATIEGANGQRYAVINLPNVPFNANGVDTSAINTAELTKQLNLEFTSVGEYVFNDIKITYNDINNAPQEKKVNAEVNIRVEAQRIPVTNVALEDSVTIEKGTIYSLVPVFTPENATDQEVTWTTDKPGIVTVDDEGVLTGVAPGTANVTVTTHDGNFSDTCIVTVTEPGVPVTRVVVQPSKLNLTTGQVSEPLVASVVPDTATNKRVIWSSSNDTVASVDQEGRVKANGTGTVIITATTEDGGYQGTCEVTVTPPITTFTAVGEKIGTGSAAAGRITVIPDAHVLESVKFRWILSDSSGVPLPRTEWNNFTAISPAEGIPLVPNGVQYIRVEMLQDFNGNGTTTDEYETVVRVVPISNDIIGDWIEQETRNNKFTVETFSPHSDSSTANSNAATKVVVTLHNLPEGVTKEQLVPRYILINTSGEKNTAETEKYVKENLTQIVSKSHIIKSTLNTHNQYVFYLKPPQSTAGRYRILFTLGLSDRNLTESELQQLYIITNPFNMEYKANLN